MDINRLTKLLLSKVRIGVLLTFVSLSTMPILLVPIFYQISAGLLGFGDDRGDFSAYEDNIIVDWMIGVLIVAILIVIGRVFVFKIGRLWEYFIAIAYFVCILPVNYILYEILISVLDVPYGNSRGEFNDLAAIFFLIGNLVILVFLLIRFNFLLRKIYR